MRAKRLKRLMDSLDEADGLLLTSLPNIFWLTGFSGSAGMALLTPERKIFITDFRYQEQSAAEVKGWEIVIAKKRLFDELPPTGLFSNGFKLGFEPDHLTYEEYQRLREVLPQIEPIPIKGKVEGLRAVKDEGEIQLMRETAKMADEAFSEILGLIHPGLKEIELATELDYRMKRKGAAKTSFETIVASGWRAALPHGLPTAKEIKRGEMVIIDFGANFRGYCSDCTRTVFIGEPDERQRKIYELVRRAQKAGLEGARAGVKASELDGIPRHIIEEAGYGPNFGHSLGHGVGTLVHEEPRVSALSEATLQEGMVVTIEPGIYIPDWGGVRIEDMVVIRENGCEPLTGLTKDLIQL